MKFTKMHGIGNDYVYVNCLTETVDDPCETARFISDRHFGVGSDGLILIKPSDKADFMMDMYNSDGSQGAMCGNGIRCVAKYVYDYGLTDKTRIAIETKSGIKYLDLTLSEGLVSMVRVNMGAPDLKAGRIPIISDHDNVVNEPIEVGGQVYRMTGVSMGNPHAVVYMEDVAGLEIEKTGPMFENHPRFPDRINTEFVRVIDRGLVEMRVWERGSGETLACGTGACAVAVASALNGYTADEITVKLLGGDLTVCWDREENQVYMTGPATVVFDGEIEI
ncbi:diaminopimelate epimerase [Ruminococcus gauvreauii]|uniref:diaminopimelate epimerase n=1 Tax=Ruminococcus gauvreauii TaxID=438033 RepID=UPI0039843CE3